MKINLKQLKTSVQSSTAVDGSGPGLHSEESGFEVCKKSAK